MNNVTKVELSSLRTGDGGESMVENWRSCASLSYPSNGGDTSGNVPSICANLYNFIFDKMQ
jgi:hypothetical protein